MIYEYYKFVMFNAVFWGGGANGPVFSFGEIDKTFEYYYKSSLLKINQWEFYFKPY